MTNSGWGRGDDGWRKLDWVFVEFLVTDRGSGPAVTGYLL